MKTDKNKKKKPKNKKKKKKRKPYETITDTEPDPTRTIDTSKLEGTPIISDDVLPLGVDLDDYHIGETEVIKVAEPVNPNLPEHLCSPELLANVGYSVRAEAVKETLIMCPRIEHSCCTIKD